MWTTYRAWFNLKTVRGLVRFNLWIIDIGDIILL